MSRLTKYRADIQAYDYIELRGGISQAVTNKLGKLEDLLQYYNVKDLEELDKLLEMATTYEELSKQIGCPLDLVLIPYFISGLKKVWYHNQWCDVVRVVAYEEATTPYMEVRCKDYDYLKFIPLTNYKKTFWIREDKSE